MKANRKNVFKLAGVYAGVMLGAGFASGQELIQYFVRFGPLGMAGLVVSGLILALTGWAVMDICVRHGLKNYDEFLAVVLGKRLGAFINAAVLAFIMVLFSAMLSASGALANEAFGLPFSAGVIIMAIICFLTFQFGINGIIKINTILTPVFVVGGIFFIVYTLVTRNAPAFAPAAGPLSGVFSGWIWAAVVYASYNVITSVSMLANMNPLIDNRKTAKYAGLLGGAILAGLGVVFALPLLLDFAFLSRFELPLLALARNHGNLIEFLYIALLLSAIYTTAAANGYAVVKSSSKWLAVSVKGLGLRVKRKNRVLSGPAVTVVGAGLAHVGFSSLVANVFPVFGYIGLFEIVVILIFFIFGRSKTNF